MVKNLIGNTSGEVNPKTPTPANPIASLSNNTKVAEPKLTPPASSSAAPANKPSTTNDKDAALNLLESWAKAWSSQDVSKYLNYYAKDFQTPKGESRQTWAQDRRERIKGKGRINVRVDDANVNIDGNTATIKFKQFYTSDRLSATSRKVLVLTKQDGKWLIKQERSGS